ncbi:MAG: hypothetical protein HN348_12290, partial [Proteobacteria bacterium]|nr:hypothetical protein [Pseudomonadota bacterium]
MCWRLSVLVIPFVCACSLTMDELDELLYLDDQESPESPADLHTVVSLAIGDDLKLNVGEEVDLDVVATFGDGATGDVTSVVEWTVGDADIAKITKKGILKANSEGETEVVAWHDGVGSAPLTVEVVGTPLPDLYICIHLSHSRRDPSRSRCDGRSSRRCRCNRPQSPPQSSESQPSWSASKSLMP